MKLIFEDPTAMLVRNAIALLQSVDISTSSAVIERNGAINRGIIILASDESAASAVAVLSHCGALGMAARPLGTKRYRCD